MRPPRDPMERIIYDALLRAGEPFQIAGENGQTLDFYLTERDVHIECKQFAAEGDRASRQLRRSPNVILVQGRPAVTMLARLIERGFE